MRASPAECTGHRRTLNIIIIIIIIIVTTIIIFILYRVPPVPDAVEYAVRGRAAIEANAARETVTGGRRCRARSSRHRGRHAAAWRVLYVLSMAYGYGGHSACPRGGGVGNRVRTLSSTTSRRKRYRRRPRCPQGARPPHSSPSEQNAIFFLTTTSHGKSVMKNIRFSTITTHFLRNLTRRQLKNL